MADDRDFSKSRSSGYQILLLEIPCSPELITDFSDSHCFGDNRYNEELFELKEKLKVAFWRLVDDELTERQGEILHLVAEGLTQVEVAKKLLVNQSSVTKSILGNISYFKNDSGKVIGKKTYGGSKKRLKKIIEKDSEIQTIFKRIAEIQEFTY